jgi:hypothetical protein
MFKRDQSQQTEQREFALLPDGIYRIFVSEIVYKDTKAGTGKYFAVTQCVVEPDRLNKRKFWSNFNFENPNPQAVQIGQAQLSDFLFAIDVDDFNSAPDLAEKSNGKECLIELVTKKAQGNYPERQEVSTHWNLEGKHRNSKRNIDLKAKTAWWGSDLQMPTSKSNDEEIPF